MTDLRLRYNCGTDLSDFPTIATLVGVYMAAFGSFELALWHTYGIIVKLDEDEAMFLLGQIQSFSTRLDCIEKFFDNRRDDMECNFLAKQVLRGEREVNSFRNKLSHGLYLTDEAKSKVYLSVFTTDPKRASHKPVLKDEPTFFELSETKLKTETAKITHCRHKNRELLVTFRPGKVTQGPLPP